MKKRLMAIVLAMVMAVSMALPVYAAEGGTSDRFTDPPGTISHEDNEVHGDPDNPDIGVGYGSSELEITITEPAKPCEHTIKYTCNGDGTHDGTCSKCNVRIIHNQMCTDEDDNLKCDNCEGGVDCREVNVTYRDNGDNKTHNKVCLGGGHAEHVLKENIPHNANDAGTQCIDCGAAIACEHPEDQREIRSNAKNAEGKLTHSIVCKSCGVVLSTVECSDADNDGDLKCDTEGCTNEFPCKHEDKEWLTSQTLNWVFDASKTTDGKSWHKTTCPDPDCQAEGHEIWGECYSADKDCTCDECKNVAHTFKWLDDNNNKTHSYKCGVCGKSTGEPGYTVPDGHEATENHADGDKNGYCNLCGFDMSRSGKPVMVAEVPAVISISATQDGRVTVAENLVIKNISKKALRVDAIQADTLGWYPQDIAGDFSAKGPFQLEVKGVKQDYYGFIGISLRGECLTKPGGTFNPDNWIIQPEDSLPLNMACRVSPQSETRNTMSAGKIMFSLEWYDGDVTSAKDKGASDQDRYNDGVGEKVYTITFNVQDTGHYTVVGSTDPVQTDIFGRVPQLPDVIPASGYTFRGWYYGLTAVKQGQTISGDRTLVPMVSKVSTSTVTFSTQGLPSGATVSLENSETLTVTTGGDGRLYTLATVSGLPDNYRFMGWVTSTGTLIKAGSLISSNITLYPSLEKNGIDPVKMRNALGDISTLTGTLSVEKTASNPSTGTDISLFNDGSVKLMREGSNASITGTGTAIPVNARNLFSALTNVTHINISDNVDWSGVTNMSRFFAGDAKLTDVSLGSVDLSQVTDMSYMFSDCAAIGQAQCLKLVRDADTSNVQNMAYMFSGCSSIQLINLTSLETDSLLNMEGMFKDCRGATTFNAGGVSTGTVTNMHGLFYGCSSLTELDLSTMSMTAVQKAGYMFANCEKLDTLKVSNTGIGAMTDMSYMFAGTIRVGTYDLTGWSLPAECNLAHMCDVSRKTITGLSEQDMTRLSSEGCYSPDSPITHS